MNHASLLHSATRRTPSRAGTLPPVWALVGSVVLASAAHAQEARPLPDARTGTPARIAAVLLDESADVAAREALARDVAPRAADVVTALVAGLPDGDETEEYRRIPWIWRVAVAAGRAADEAALEPLLDASMPADGEPLRDWQAVVLGGGVVMGLSQAGRWPKDVMAPWLADNPVRARRWSRSLALARAMANDGKVRNGTRYDALRMLGVLPWDQAGTQLIRYLGADADPELQMGAIGGLSDLQDDRAAEALIRHVAHYTERNRGLAIAALLRTDGRRAKLKDAVARGVIQPAWLTADQARMLQP